MKSFAFWAPKCLNFYVMHRRIVAAGWATTQFVRRERLFETWLNAHQTGALFQSPPPHPQLPHTPYPSPSTKKSTQKTVFQKEIFNGTLRTVLLLIVTREETMAEARPPSTLLNRVNSLSWHYFLLSGTWERKSLFLSFFWDRVWSIVDWLGGEEEWVRRLK